jgi:hypothetical protein
MMSLGLEGFRKNKIRSSKMKGEVNSRRIEEVKRGFDEDLKNFYLAKEGEDVG